MTCLLVSVLMRLIQLVNLPMHHMNIENAIILCVSIILTVKRGSFISVFFFYIISFRLLLISWAMPQEKRILFHANSKDTGQRPNTKALVSDQLVFQYLERFITILLARKISRFHLVSVAEYTSLCVTTSQPRLHDYFSRRV